MDKESTLPQDVPESRVVLRSVSEGNEKLARIACYLVIRILNKQNFEYIRYDLIKEEHSFFYEGWDSLSFDHSKTITISWEAQSQAREIFKNMLSNVQTYLDMENTNENSCRKKLCYFETLRDIFVLIDDESMINKNQDMSRLLEDSMRPEDYEIWFKGFQEQSQKQLAAKKKMD
jgi:hypothetical protein